jgi:hypothetical protein
MGRALPRAAALDSPKTHMFTSWLLNVFPAEMLRGWRLVQRDLALWIALFGLLAIAALSIPANPEDVGGFQVLWLLLIPTFTDFLAAVLFEAALAKREVDWSEVFTRFAQRAAMFFAYYTAAGFLLVGTAILVSAACAVALNGSELRLMVNTVAVAVITTSLMARFCFVPFFAALDDKEVVIEKIRLDSDREPILRLFWPFLASDRIGMGRRWRIVPYAFLVLWMGRVVVLLLPPSFLLFGLVASRLASLTATAVLFLYYDAGRRALKIAPAAAEPEISI